MVAWQVFVRVPVRADFLRGGVFCAAVDLDKTDASLNKTASEKALSSEWSDIGIVDSECLLSEKRLAADVGGFRST